MLYNSNEIQQIIPHRYPFLLVDAIESINEDGTAIVGRKCVSANEMQFLGHFPTQHVMPGVLVIEALAQVGAIAILSEEEHKGKTAFFGGIKNARFKKQITPGDVIEMECEITDQKGPIGSGKAVAKVDGKVAVTAELTFVVGA